MSIRSGGIHDQILKLSEIAPSGAPANFNSAVPQNLYPNFHSCLAAHHMDKFGEVISTAPKLVALIR